MLSAQKRRAAFGIQARRRNCKQQQCSEQPIFEDDNCINRCISEECYAKIYAREPLEAGEVDRERWLRFSECYSLEKRTLIRDDRPAAST